MKAGSPEVPIQASRRWVYRNAWLPSSITPSWTPFKSPITPTPRARTMTPSALAPTTTHWLTMKTTAFRWSTSWVTTSQTLNTSMAVCICQAKLRFQSNHRRPGRRRDQASLWDASRWTLHASRLSNRSWESKRRSQFAVSAAQFWLIAPVSESNPSQALQPPRPLRRRPLEISSLRKTLISLIIPIPIRHSLSSFLAYSKKTNLNSRRELPLQSMSTFQWSHKCRWCQACQ